MLTRVSAVAPPFTHLSRLTDERGVFEHALEDVPREEHGYCVDDAARALVVAIRDPNPSPRVVQMAEVYLGLVESAIEPDGSAHNRMNHTGQWIDHAGHGDWWGRAIWALGVAGVHAPLASSRKRAFRAYSRATRRRSPDLRAMVFAGLGAAEMLTGRPHLGAARELVLEAGEAIPLSFDPAWPWPEPRLRYSNGNIPEVLIFGGATVGDSDMLERGLALLTFLVGNETSGGHLSVTGQDGRGPGERGPLFDQQPVEVAAIADACARAWDATHDGHWRDVVGLAWEWFLGENDSGTVMIDMATGAGHDGLTPVGRNANRGAESTLAALSTYQQARRLGLVKEPP